MLTQTQHKTSRNRCSEPQTDPKYKTGGHDEPQTNNKNTLFAKLEGTADKIRQTSNSASDQKVVSNMPRPPEKKKVLSHFLKVLPLRPTLEHACTADLIAFGIVPPTLLFASRKP